MLTATNFLHSTGVMHRDIKPGNILMDKECQVKYCDFGLSRCVVQPTKEEKIDKLQVITKKNTAPTEKLSYFEEEKTSQNKRRLS